MKNVEWTSVAQPSAVERAAEIAAILALALVRAHSVDHTAHFPEKRPVRVDFRPKQSVHTHPS